MGSALTVAASLRLAVSSCLLGFNVRYDGAHKRDTYIKDTLGRYAELIPLCPEVAIGLGVPRPPIHLVGPARAPRAVGVERPRLDVTTRLVAYARQTTNELTDISGYIFKSRSPSCGLTDVPVQSGRRPVFAAGIYAGAWRGRRPLLPVIDEVDLGEAGARDAFFERVFCYHRWQQLLIAGPTIDRLRAFHATHELTLTTHGPRRAAALGRWLLAADRDAGALASHYFGDVMKLLAQPTTRARHAAALALAARRLGPRLDGRQRARLEQQIRGYRAGAVPRAVPLKLLRQHIRSAPRSARPRSVYLFPPRAERALRGDN